MKRLQERIEKIYGERENAVEEVRLQVIEAEEKLN